MELDLNLKEVWAETLDIVKKEIDEPNYQAWLDLTTPIKHKEDRVVVEVINEFFLEWLEIRYKDLFNKTLTELNNKDTQVEFITPGVQRYNNMVKEEKRNNQQKIRKDKSIKKKKTPSNSNNTLRLNPKYTFETFVIGNSNRFAHAASMAVAEAPAKAYNPLFIYGDVGLGKTHLMQAIGHSAYNYNSKSSILYVSSETFTNELINAIRDDKTVEFRNKYRNIDILLIDDIQFLAEKERTQEEFFHTFNALHEANKQLVISSDRPPKEIPTLEERLRSRFEWGLITDIQDPDFETRVAILHKKASFENLSVPKEVIHYIAKAITSNIRELEGALIRVVAYSSLTNTDINLSLAKDALKDIIPESKPRKITPKLIKEIVSKIYGLEREDMESKKRTQIIAFPRQIAMYLTREMTDLSLPQIGDQFGGRDHTTVLHAHKKITKNLKEDTELENKIKKIKTQIKSL